MHITYRPAFRRASAFFLFLCLLGAESVSAASIKQEVYARTVRRLSRMKNATAKPSSLTATAVRPYLVPTGVRRAARSSAASSSAPSATDLLRQEVVRLVNIERAKVDLHPLATNPLLQRSAQLYAEAMVAQNFFSHRDPNGKNSLDRIRAIGYLQPPCDCSWRYMTGENLARGQTTAAQVVRDWMNSTSHRANLLHHDFQEIGIGFLDNNWVQHFGLVEAR